MKKQFLLLGAILFGVSALAQQSPTNNAPSGAAASGQNNQQFWSRAGNNNSVGQNNIFGTLWNSPIYTVTNGVNRMKLNGDISYTINGLAGNRNGFLLLTNNPSAASWGAGLSPMNSSNFGAYALFHLIGDDSPNVQEGGYRNWMRNGILLSNNYDAGFVGIRKMPNITSPGGDDVSDFVINWSDNTGVNPTLRGPDNLVFNFTKAI